MTTPVVCDRRTWWVWVQWESKAREIVAEQIPAVDGLIWRVVRASSFAARRGEHIRQEKLYDTEAAALRTAIATVRRDEAALTRQRKRLEARLLALLDKGGDP